MISSICDRTGPIVFIGLKKDSKVLSPVAGMIESYSGKEAVKRTSIQ